MIERLAPVGLFAVKLNSVNGKKKENKLAKVKSEDVPENSRLFKRVSKILDSAKSNVTRSVNTEMISAYWLIGQAIVEDERQGAERAGYGEEVIRSLAARLKSEGLKGFGRNNLWFRRQFYLTYSEKLHALRAELSWTHYRLLLKVESDRACEFYETESAAGNWSTRELERQINSHFFERTGASVEKRKMLEAGRAPRSCWKEIAAEIRSEQEKLRLLAAG